MFVADALMDFQRIFGSPCQLTVYSGYSRSRKWHVKNVPHIIRTFSGSDTYDLCELLTVPCVGEPKSASFGAIAYRKNTSHTPTPRTTQNSMPTIVAASSRPLDIFHRPSVSIHSTAWPVMRQITWEKTSAMNSNMESLYPANG